MERGCVYCLQGIKEGDPAFSGFEYFCLGLVRQIEGNLGKLFEDSVPNKGVQGIDNVNQQVRSLKYDEISDRMEYSVDVEGINRDPNHPNC